MKKLVLAATLTAIVTPAFGQTAVGVGTGIASSRADSRSTAVAVSGQGGTGVGTGGNPTANVTIQGTQIPTATTTTVNNQGTSTVKNVPSVFAPGLAAAGLETCLGSVSGGGSFVGTGFSFGTTIPDPGCGARLDARTLWSMGLRKAAVARLCLNPDIKASMPEVCGQYLPTAVPAGYESAVRPQPVPSYYLSEGEGYKGGLVMLIDGKTGKERLCKNYDEPKQRCRAWDGETHVVVHHAKKRVQVANTAASPTPPEAGKAEGKTE